MRLLVHVDLYYYIFLVDTPTSSLHESPLVDTSVEGAEGGETESRGTGGGGRSETNTVWWEGR